MVDFFRVLQKSLREKLKQAPLLADSSRGKACVNCPPPNPLPKGRGLYREGLRPSTPRIRKLSASAVLRTAMLVWGQSVANVPHLRENMKQAPLAVST